MIIIPGPLRETVQELQVALEEISHFTPPAKVVQVDIIDGEYADMLTFEPSALDQIDNYGLQFDLHLMTIEPIDFIGELQPVRSIRRIIAQVERMSSISEFVTLVTEDLGFEAGISLDLYTRFEDVGSDLFDSLHKLSVVQVMGNKAGQQGLPLHPVSLETLREVVAYRKNHDLNFDVAVDIGMNATTVPQVKEIGATEVVVGSYLQGPDAQAHWQQLRQL